MVIIFWAHNPIFLMLLLLVSDLRAKPNNTSLKPRCQIKISNWIWHIYLKFNLMIACMQPSSAKSKWFHFLMLRMNNLQVLSCWYTHTHTHTLMYSLTNGMSLLLWNQSHLYCLLNVGDFNTCCFCIANPLSSCQQLVFCFTKAF